MWSTAWCPLVTSLWNALKCSSGRLTTTNGKTEVSQGYLGLTNSS